MNGRMKGQATKVLDRMKTEIRALAESDRPDKHELIRSSILLADADINKINVAIGEQGWDALLKAITGLTRSIQEQRLALLGYDPDDERPVVSLVPPVEEPETPDPSLFDEDEQPVDEEPDEPTNGRQAAAEDDRRWAAEPGEDTLTPHLIETAKRKMREADDR